jgi:hypothetical protein
MDQSSNGCGGTKFSKKVRTNNPFIKGANDANLPMLIDKIFDVLDQSSIPVKSGGWVRRMSTICSESMKQITSW